MALAELRRRVAVELQRLGQRRGRVRAHRAVAGRRRRDLGDPAHPDRVMVAPGQQRLPRRRTQRRRVEAVVLQPGRSQALRRRRRARPAERTRRAKADVVEQHHDYVRRPRRRPQRLDRRKRRIRILGVVGDQARRTAGRGSATPHDRRFAARTSHYSSGIACWRGPERERRDWCDPRRTASAGPVGTHHTPDRARRSRERRAPRAGSAFGPLSAVETAQIGAESGPTARHETAPVSAYLQGIRASSTPGRASCHAEGRGFESLQPLSQEARFGGPSVFLGGRAGRLREFLLARHGDVEAFFGRDEVVEVLGGGVDVDLDPLDGAGEAAAVRCVFVADG